MENFIEKKFNDLRKEHFDKLDKMYSELQIKFEAKKDSPKLTKVDFDLIKGGIDTFGLRIIEAKKNTGHFDLKESYDGFKDAYDYINLRIEKL